MEFNCVRPVDVIPISADAQRKRKTDNFLETLKITTMAKLFIFGIGGTGSRVIKSLTMLLSAGLKAENDFEIVPIIIDPHKDN